MNEYKRRMLLVLIMVIAFTGLSVVAFYEDRIYLSILLAVNSLFGIKILIKNIIKNR